MFFQFKKMPFFLLVLTLAVGRAQTIPPCQALMEASEESEEKKVQNPQMSLNIPSLPILELLKVMKNFSPSQIKEITVAQLNSIRRKERHLVANPINKNSFWDGDLTKKKNWIAQMDISQIKGLKKKLFFAFFSQKYEIEVFTDAQIPAITMEHLHWINDLASAADLETYLIGRAYIEFLYTKLRLFSDETANFLTFLYNKFAHAKIFLPF